MVGSDLSVSAGRRVQSFRDLYGQIGDRDSLHQFHLFRAHHYSGFLHRTTNIRSSRGNVVGMASRAVPLCLVLGNQVGMGDEPRHVFVGLSLLVRVANGRCAVDELYTGDLVWPDSGESACLCRQIFPANANLGMAAVRSVMGPNRVNESGAPVVASLLRGVAADHTITVPRRQEGILVCYCCGMCIPCPAQSLGDSKLYRLPSLHSPPQQLWR